MTYIINMLVAIRKNKTIDKRLLSHISQACYCFVLLYEPEKVIQILAAQTKFISDNQFEYMALRTYSVPYCIARCVYLHNDSPQKTIHIMARL